MDWVYYGLLKVCYVTGTVLATEGSDLVSAFTDGNLGGGGRLETVHEIREVTFEAIAGTQDVKGQQKDGEGPAEGPAIINTDDGDPSCPLVDS